MKEAFWIEEFRRQRMATYRCRFLSWKLGRTVVPPPFFPGDHWWHLPLRYADTGLPI